MKEQPFTLEARDKNEGTVYLPEGVDGPLAALVYCHGWKEDQQLPPLMKSLCSELSRSSMAIVAFDFFGCGKTGGEYAEMSYGRWESNLHDVVEWVGRQNWVDPKKIGCLGVSSGSTAALRYAANADEPAFVISVGTCLGLHVFMPNAPARVLIDNLDDLCAGGTAMLDEVPFGIDFFKDFLSGAPAYRLDAIKCPVLFLQGSDDKPWRRADAWTGYQVMTQEGLPVKHREIEGGDHALDNRSDESAAEIVNWLRNVGILSS